MSADARRKHFDALAHRWEFIRSSEEGAAAVEQGLDLVEPLAETRVADVGSGTGVVLGPLLRRLGRSGSVLAVDLSSAMLGIAKERHPDPRVTWLVADATEAAIPRDSFDVVLCFDAFPHFGEPGPALGALAHWLAPGGRLLLWHDVGRERLAAIHAHAGSALAGDLLPPVSTLADLARQRGLAVLEAKEDEKSYLVLARCDRGGNGAAAGRRG